MERWRQHSWWQVFWWINSVYLHNHFKVPLNYAKVNKNIPELLQPWHDLLEHFNEYLFLSATRYRNIWCCIFSASSSNATWVVSSSLLRTSSLNQFPVEVGKTFLQTKVCKNNLPNLASWRDWTRFSESWKMALNPLTAKPTKWSNTLKQFVGCCLSMFDHFVDLADKGLI